MDEQAQRVVPPTRGEGADYQTITQIHKAFKGELTDWLFSLKLLGIDTNDFESVKTAFENDYRVIKSPKTEPETFNPINQTEEDEFITVRNNKNKQTCNYCKKQGHSIPKCWTLNKKNKLRAEQSRLNHQQTQTKPIHKNNYICPISNSQEASNEHQNQQEMPKMTNQQQEVEANPSMKDTKNPRKIIRNI